MKESIFALPGFQEINHLSEYCLDNIDDTKGLKRAGYYLGWRIVSLIAIPTNAISTAVSLALAILTLPLAAFSNTRDINVWAWKRTAESLVYTLYHTLYSILGDVIVCNRLSQEA